MIAMSEKLRHRCANERAHPLTLTAFTVALFLLAALLAAPPASANVAQRIDAILAEQRIAQSSAGIFIWDLDAARIVYSRNPDVAVAPASNMKLVTAAAALIDWGADHRFTTQLSMSNVRVINGTLHGNLYLNGAGDPSLSTRKYQRRELGFSTAALDAFVSSVRARGVTTITGGVIGDESWFDEERTVSSWKPGLEASCGPLSALTANEGWYGNKRVDEPPVYAAALLTNALRKAGIKVKGKPSSGVLPTSAALIQEQRSANLSVLLARMNKQSDNHFAEVVLKGLGKDGQDLGSTAAGARQSELVLASIAIPAEASVIADGSGLSYGNRLTPHAIVRVLGAMAQRPDYGVYRDSLAIAGKDGTLHDRMRGTKAQGNARAKTGTLNVATSLSGYVTSANNHLVAFSILVTGNPVDWERGNKAQDAIVVALANARLAGKHVLRVSPNLRQRPASGVDAVHTVGRALQPCVQP